VSSWLKSPEKIKSMQNAAADSARPNATLNIARDIAELAFSTAKQDKPSDGEALVMVR
jgi:UDP-N-acetylglucosamine:LPS N-acetylglucosamine transferase